MNGQATGWHPRTIIVGYDGTSSAELALSRAAEIGATFASHVIVADIAPPDPAPAPPGAFGLGAYNYIDTTSRLQRLDESVWQEHRIHVETLLSGRNVRYEFATAIGEPIRELVDLAAERAAELIVVGTREPGFFDRLLGGSVSQGVARQATCDVLIVHPTGGSQTSLK